MGTRNLTAVMIDEKYKVAQYGQWDGYPDGQGTTILEFLRDKMDKTKFLAQLKKVRFVDREGVDKEFLEAYDKNAPKWSNDPDNRTPEQKCWFSGYISRDLGAEILNNILNSDEEEILLEDSVSFAGESLFCEWAYVIDFDKGTFEVYKGFNKDPLADGERFKHMDKKDDYYPVRLAAKFNLNELPTDAEFLDNFKNDDEED